ncbi:helix-turn-helix domain-containing protein [bacterium]|nr:helix-turn-helix domain-containing protein [bacterium]
MTNYVGEWFSGIRGERGWSLAEVARRLGYTNISKCANKVLRLEREGVADDHFVRRLAAVLGISDGVVAYLCRADRLAYERAWREWADQPVPVRVVVRAVPGFMVELAVTVDVTRPEEVVAFGRAYAARHHKKVFVVLSRRRTVGITESGEIDGTFEATPESDPCPGMSVGRVKFLFRLGGTPSTETKGGAS